jgi:MFS transporter, PAT family, beta-lactamase induction signal transducer AmpG
MTKSYPSWRRAVSVYAQRRVLSMVLLGFYAGLPYAMVTTTLSAWLADEQISLSLIGYFSLVSITHSIKVFWAPVVDRLPLPFLNKSLGKRRSWMLVTQFGIVLGLLAISQTDIHQHLYSIAILAVFIAFCSSTQDIVIDAYRIEAAVAEFQGAMAAMYVFGYRLSVLVAGAGVLYLAEFYSWRFAYLAMASAMLVGIITTLAISEPELSPDQTAKAIERNLESALGISEAQTWPVFIFKWFSDAVISPFVEFFQRSGKAAVLILLLIGVYKVSDITMGVMAMPFYLDLGFSKKQIADITKLFGFFMTIFGTYLGGALVVRFGIMRPLLLGAILACSTNLLFVALAVSQPSISLLALVISVDNLSGGIATASFIAYLSGLTNTTYTATQYALFSSLMTLPAKLIGSFSGDIALNFGYPAFFVYSTIIGIPVIGLVVFLMQARFALGIVQAKHSTD